MSLQEILKNLGEGLVKVIITIGEALDLIANSSIKIALIFLAFVLFRAFGMDSNEANELLLDLLQLVALWAFLSIFAAIILGVTMLIESTTEKTKELLITISGALALVSFIVAGWLSSKSKWDKLMVIVFVIYLVAIGYWKQRKEQKKGE